MDAKGEFNLNNKSSISTTTAKPQSTTSPNKSLDYSQIREG